MGLSYVVLSLLMGSFITGSLNVAATIGNVTSGNGFGVNIGAIFGLLVVPIGALVGLVITTPVYLLFVNDKNAGVLEYLLAVGMNQRQIFMGYLKASLALSLIALTPVMVINTAFHNGGLSVALLGAGLAFATGIADVALVTVLMTAFSSMQRRPTGMNSPIGISIGVFLLIPELLIIALTGSFVALPLIVLMEVVIALAIAAAAAFFMLSLDRMIKREKLLP